MSQQRIRNEAYRGPIRGKYPFLTLAICRHKGICPTACALGELKARARTLERHHKDFNYVPASPECPLKHHHPHRSSGLHRDVRNLSSRVNKDNPGNWRIEEKEAREYHHYRGQDSKEQSHGV